MPPRKSTSSIPPADNEEPSSPTSAVVAGTQATEQQLKAQSEGVSVEDLLLPRAVTQRLAKSVLPPDTAIQKDALLAIQKAATVFVSYLSSHANEATLKRTLAPSDVLNALSELEFEFLRPQLERELDAHTEALADKKKAAKDRKAAISGETPSDSKVGDGSAVVHPVTASAVKTQKDSPVVFSVVKGNKRVKRDSGENERTNGQGSPDDETDVDEDETEEEEEEEEEEVEDDDEQEEEEDEEVEEQDGDDYETQDAEDLDRVEDLDGKPSANYHDSGSSDDDDTGPAAQLRSNMGFG